VQEVEGQTHSFVQHIQLGVREAAADPDALLLFSGGKTRKCGDACLPACMHACLPACMHACLASACLPACLFGLRLPAQPAAHGCFSLCCRHVCLQGRGAESGGRGLLAGC
jgi:hypothetical protein